MQLEIKPYEKAQPIEWNFEELKASLAEKVEHYKTLQYTPEQIAAAKTDRAALNGLKKALTDERIRREKEFMEPFQLFKSQVNELITMIDVPAKIIDAQVKEFEEYEKREKRNACVKVWEGMVDEGKVPDWLTFEMIENEKWQNKTFTIAKVTEEIEERLKKIKADTDLISALPDFAFEALECYKKHLDAGAALAEGKSLADLARRKAEVERINAQAQEIAQAANISPAQEELKEIYPDEPKAETGANMPKETVVRFECKLTSAQALLLRNFLAANGITFRQI